MNEHPRSIPTPAVLQVVRWSDPLVEAAGHRAGSPYVEAVWLGVLGPSATWTWQRLARLAQVRPATRIDTVDLATSIGLGGNLGPNSSITRTLNRLHAFGVTQVVGDTIAVRTALPDVPERRLCRLSPSARLAHDHYCTSAQAQRQRVSRLAQPTLTREPVSNGASL